jgi:CheY-like chemotaxis protein
MKMQNVIAWLRKVEDLASSVYLTAAQSDIVSPELAVFLRRLAEDEAWHFHMMGSAAELMREQPHHIRSAVLVDDETKLHVEAPLHALRENIISRRASEKDILSAIVKLETSEWNDIFVYVISTCTEMSATFQYVASTIQMHERRIERYLESVKAHPELGDVLSALPKIWTDRLLIVEDDSAVRQLLQRVLSRYGEVTTAADGLEGLRAIEQQFFNAIVTDVDMPGFDGIALLEQALQQKPHLAEHFVVCTGNMTQTVAEATERHGVPALMKPVAISKLRSTVESILQK